MPILLDAAFLYNQIPVDKHIQNYEPDVRCTADIELVSQAQKGDLSSRSQVDLGDENIKAFEELVRRYRNDVFRLAYHFTRNREDAWDLSQEVFIKVYKSLNGFRGDAQFKTWILRITANQCKDYWKKRRLHTVPLSEGLLAADSARPNQDLEAEEIGQALSAALQKLPHKHRTAFILREFEEMTYEEMAQVMQCSLGTVMSRLFHARKKLQTILADMGVVA